MAPPRKPVVLFVHGSWHSPAHFKPIVDLFQSTGYRALCPRLPTLNPPQSTTSLPDDAACIRSELKTLIEDEGEDVIVAMHSYGGIVGTEAVDAVWNKQSRQARGQPGGVLRLLYICAFVLPLNASLVSGFGGQIPPFIEIQASVWNHCSLFYSSCCSVGTWQTAFDLHKTNRMYLCTSLSPLQSPVLV